MNRGFTAAHPGFPPWEMSWPDAQGEPAHIKFQTLLLASLAWLSYLFNWWGVGNQPQKPLLESGSVPAGEGNGNPLSYSCLKNLMDRGAWQATVHGVAESWTWLSNWALTFTHKCAREHDETNATQNIWNQAVSQLKRNRFLFSKQVTYPSVRNVLFKK